MHLTAGCYYYNRQLYFSLYTYDYFYTGYNPLTFSYFQKAVLFSEITEFYKT